MIKSISYSQDEIIKSILKLHVRSGVIDLDATYSTGNFYKTVQKPKHRFDIAPKSDDVKFANAEDIPLAGNSLDCIMFDPPFLAAKGKSLNSDSGNIINRRFGVYPTESELFCFYENALNEFYRLLRKDGILIFKCQDKVSSNKQYFSHCYIHSLAVDTGFYPVDLFVLLAKNRLVATWQRNQKHARKYHSYFWVFKKCDIKICYGRKG